MILVKINLIMHIITKKQTVTPIVVKDHGRTVPIAKGVKKIKKIIPYSIVRSKRINMLFSTFL